MGLQAPYPKTGHRACRSWRSSGSATIAWEAPYPGPASQHAKLKLHGAVWCGTMFRPGLMTWHAESGPSSRLKVDMCTDLSCARSMLPSKLKLVLGPGNNQICGAIPPQVVSSNGTSFTSKLKTCMLLLPA